MNISAEEKNRYLREAEVVLAREGFLTDRTHAGIDKVIIESNTSLRFRLKNGLELRESIERTVR